MKIVKLTANNFKKLKAVEIVPEGNTVVISGKNGAGKSSVLDAIMAALCGKKACPEMPIREGEKSAKVEVDLGDFKVTRTFTQTGGAVSIVGKNGLQTKSPQAILDRTVGDLSFDPLAFFNEKPREQRQILMDMVGLTFVDLDLAFADIKAKRSEATTAGKRYQHIHDEVQDVRDYPKSR